MCMINIILLRLIKTCHHSHTVMMDNHLQYQAKQLACGPELHLAYYKIYKFVFLASFSIIILHFPIFCLHLGAALLPISPVSLVP